MSTQTAALGRDISAEIQTVLDEYRDSTHQPISKEVQVWKTFERLHAAFELTPAVQRRPTVRVDWSAGRGRWAGVPWVAFLDSRITDTTRTGVYVVLLFSQDMSGVYLSIAQGVTEPMSHGRAEGRRHLREVAEDFRRNAPRDLASRFTLDDGLRLNATTSLGRDYETSSIAYKLYERGTVPESATIGDDLEVALAAVESHRPAVVASVKAAGGPVAAVYVGQAASANLAYGLENGIWGWKNEPDALAALPVGTPIIFGAHYTGGSPRTDESKWASHGLERLLVTRTTDEPFFNTTPLWADELAGNASYPYRVHFELLAQYEDINFASSDLDPRLIEALRRSVTGGRPVIVEAELPELAITAPEEEVGLDAAAAGLREAIDTSGLVVPTGDSDRVRALLAAVVTKPFVVLSGLSGSGKTQIAMRLGEWFGSNAGGPRHLAVPVRPDWTGPEALFGYEDALRPTKAGRAAWFVPAPLHFVLRAVREPTMPFLLLLDEMNLAHVERYFADFLSGMESREPVLPNLTLGDDGEWRIDPDVPSRVALPRNLVVIGTVNVDETTYLFSPKVLDRATTFEIRTTTEELIVGQHRPRTAQAGEPPQLRAVVRHITDDDWQHLGEAERREQLGSHLRRLHELLATSGDEFGHRTFYEALRLGSAFELLGSTALLTALDHIVMLKVLPKINGSRRRVEPVLQALAGFAADPSAPVIAADSEDTAGPALPLTATKVARMLAAVSVNQFVSFTE